MSISTLPPQGRCTERNTFAYPKINDLEALFLVSRLGFGSGLRRTSSTTTACVTTWATATTYSRRPRTSPHAPVPLHGPADRPLKPATKRKGSGA